MQSPGCKSVAASGAPATGERQSLAWMWLDLGGLRSWSVVAWARAATGRRRDGPRPRQVCGGARRGAACRPGRAAVARERALCWEKWLRNSEAQPVWGCVLVVLFWFSTFFPPLAARGLFWESLATLDKCPLTSGFQPLLAVGGLSSPFSFSPG